MSCIAWTKGVRHNLDNLPHKKQVRINRSFNHERIIVVSVGHSEESLSRRLTQLLRSSGGEGFQLPNTPSSCNSCVPREKSPAAMKSKMTVEAISNLLRLASLPTRKMNHPIPRPTSRPRIPGIGMSLACTFGENCHPRCGDRTRVSGREGTSSGFQQQLGQSRNQRPRESCWLKQGHRRSRLVKEVGPFRLESPREERTEGKTAEPYLPRDLDDIFHRRESS